MPSTRGLRIVAWSSGAVIAALGVSGVVLAAVEPAGFAVGSGGVGLAAYEAAVYTMLAVLGATVVAHQPRNAIGWLLLLISGALALTTTGNHIYFQSLLASGEVTGFAAFASWMVTWLWIFAIVPAFTIFPLLFPTGRPLSSRWRTVLWVAVTAGIVTFLGTAFVPGQLVDYPAVVNPFGIDNSAIEVIGWVGFGVLVPTTFASIASVVVRFRRSSGTERQQLKWVASAAALLPVAFSGAGIDSDAEGELGYTFLLTGLLIVGIAVAVAMLRYRLYDIDVVIKRTLVYGALIATLAATYAGGVLLLQFALSPLTERSDLAVAGSTLAVAALFRPARSRIRGWVDRRFYRSRYDSARTLASFSTRLREQVNLETLSADLRGVVEETLQPVNVSLWLRP